MADAPIGIFDSGLGGLTVARAVLDQLPHESLLYVGDSLNAPYGPRPIAQVRELSIRVLDYLVDSGVKMLVIACNSASAAVLHDARERYDVPVIEVIRPAVRAASAVSKSGRVGVICTQATATSGAYKDAFAAATHVVVTTQPCPRFVHFVESGVTTGPELLGAAREYLQPLVDAEVDTVVLGCTHYPLLSGAISYVLGETSPRPVTLVSSAQATANEVYRVLAELDLERDEKLPPPEHRMLTTGDSEKFADLAARFLGNLPQQPELTGEVPKVKVE